MRHSRHTYATEMVRSAVSLPAIMKLLGHTSLDMTMLYLDIALTDLLERVPSSPLTTALSCPSSQCAGGFPLASAWTALSILSSARSTHSRCSAAPSLTAPSATFSIA
jgi:hypothetical protein